MKKCLSIFLTLLMVLSVGTISAMAYGTEHEAYTNVVYANDFKNFPYTYYFQGMGYNIGSGLSSSTDNILVDFDDGHEKVFKASMKKAANGDGHYVKVYGTSSGTSAFSAYTDAKWEISVDIRLDAVARLDVNLRLGSSGSKWFTPLRFMANGHMTDETAKAFESGGFEVDYGTYSTKTWYSVKIYVDLKAKTYSLSLNGQALETNKSYDFADNNCLYDMYLGLSAGTLTDEIISGDNWMYLDNLSFATMDEVYGYDYTDDAGYKNVLISDDFESNSINSNVWYTPNPASISVADDPAGTRGKVAKLQGSYPRLYSGYNTAGKKLIAEQYTTEELGRVKLQMDLRFDNPTASSIGQLNVNVYDAYNNKTQNLIKFLNGDKCFRAFGSSGMDQYAADKCWVAEKWYTVTLYLDFEKGLGTAKVSDGNKEWVLRKDYDISNLSGFSGDKTRIDSIWIESGDSTVSGACYADNISLSVMVPEVKIVPTSNTTGTVYFTYAPDMYKKGPAVLVIATKKGDKLVNTELVTLKATKLTAAEVTSKYGATGAYATQMTDDNINAYHTTAISRDYLKAADETIEIYLWNGTESLTPLCSAIK